MRHCKQMSIPEVLKLLELVPNCFNLQQNMPLEIAKKNLSKFHELIKKQRKTLAKKYHPDKLNGDASKMKEINSLIDSLLSIRIQVTPPRPHHSQVHVYVHRDFGTSSTSTSTSTSGWL